MKIALIGYGAMGNSSSDSRRRKGHNVVAIVEAGTSFPELAEKLRDSDVAIDFSSAEAVRRNIEVCLLTRIPLVEGTTGWNEQLDSVGELVRREGGALIYGANFSIGVNLFYRIADFTAELFANSPNTRPYRGTAPFP